MAFYAQTDNSIGLVSQEEMAEQRRVADLIKQIGYYQANVMTNLEMWLRWRDQPSAAADQAMARLVEARRAENELFRHLFRIDDQRRALPKR